MRPLIALALLALFLQLLARPSDARWPSKRVPNDGLPPSGVLPLDEHTGELVNRIMAVYGKNATEEEMLEATKALVTGTRVRKTKQQLDAELYDKGMLLRRDLPRTTKRQRNDGLPKARDLSLEEATDDFIERAWRKYGYNDTNCTALKEHAAYLRANNAAHPPPAPATAALRGRQLRTTLLHLKAYSSIDVRTKQPFAAGECYITSDDVAHTVRAKCNLCEDCHQTVYDTVSESRCRWQFLWWCIGGYVHHTEFKISAGPFVYCYNLLFWTFCKSDAYLRAQYIYDTNSDYGTGICFCLDNCDRCQPS